MVENPVLSQSSRRILRLAYEEADRFGHDYVGSEHLLIALLEEPSWGALLLQSQSLRATRARSAMDFILGRGKKNLPLVSGRQTADTVRVLNGAASLARQSDNPRVQPEHLLLALTNERETPGAKTLQSFECNLEALAARLWQHLQETKPARRAS